MAVGTIATAGNCLSAYGLTTTRLQAGRTVSGKSMGLDMTIAVDSLQLPSNRRVILRPIICCDTDTATFDPVVINGRNAAIAYERNSSERVDDAIVVSAKQAKTTMPQGLNYSSRIPYQDWMGNSKVYIVEDQCGCGRTEPGTLDGLEPVAEVVSVEAIEPVCTYVVPEVEAVKERVESGRAYIDFPVNQVQIYRDYHNNASELDKILSIVEIGRNDSHVDVESVTIHGYASPEGSYANNTRLASERARVLSEYVAKLSGVDRSKFNTQSTPEDWEGLRTYLKDGSVANSTEILALIDDIADPDARDAAIRTRYPQSYARILADIYPVLRHSDYAVRYVVRHFTLEEARQYMATHPTYLSIDEYFMVANSYPALSSERAKALYMAADIYPDDATAQLNAGCVALQRGDQAVASHYLEKAGDRPEALNARGVLAMLAGDYTTAETLLRQALEGGCDDAQTNLRSLAACQVTSTQTQLND